MIELLDMPGVAKLLGGPKILKVKIANPLDMRKAVRAGLPALVVEQMARLLDVPVAEVLRITGISLSTWARRRAEKVLSESESDRVYRLARIVLHAATTLGNVNKAREWLFQTNRALSGEKPFDLLDTEVGVEQVAAVLDRIEYGVY
jgi:putative toxin-antitoxin system antitoxin component (TIGR02293 family)